jgi:hypothetical protein
MVKTTGYALWALCIVGSSVILLSCKGNKETQPDAKTSFLQPPIPELNPPFERFRFDASKGLDWKSKSGSHIQLPANALVDASDQPVTGLVDLNYREMQLASDIFLAGIPMAYQGGHFTTAGSFELRVGQDTNPLFMKSGSKAQVNFASNTGGEDFDFFKLDESQKSWSNLGRTNPVSNVEKQKLKRELAKRTPPIRFPLDRKYFAFNYDAILDIETDLGWNTADRKNLNARLTAYGLGWENAEVWQRIDFKGNSEHAALMVWRNVMRKPFPDWVKRQWGELKPLGSERYLYTVANEQDSTQVFAVELEAVMPLRTLFAFAPEKWKKDYYKVMAKIREEETRIAQMAEVYRNFELSEFGIYNWDKLMKEENRVELAASFEWNAVVNSRLSELTVVLIGGDNRSVINYPSSSWGNMALTPDPGARLFCILPGNKLAVFPATAFKKIDFARLRNQTSPAYRFEMELKSLDPLTADHFKSVLQL